MKLLAIFFLVLLSFAVSIFVLIFGWGLEPQSWTAIVVGFIAGLGVQITMAAIMS